MSPVDLPKLYDTCDLHLASFLLCTGYPIGQIGWNDGRASFVFSDTPTLRQALLDYANDGKVPVRSFCNSLRDLKAITRPSGGAAARAAAGRNSR